MYAMILAAGKGERMQPLSLHTPKPLLSAGGKPLLQYHIEALAAAGVANIVINTGRLGHLIERRFGSGTGFGVRIHYSHEGDEPLGTGGGILKALPQLGNHPFLLINGDVWTDIDYTTLPVRPSGLAHLVMVENPAHHPKGDFALLSGRVAETGQPMLTYSGIGVYQPGLFVRVEQEVFSFVPLLRQAISENRVSGQLHSGRWFDIGTPQRLEMLHQLLLETRK